MQNKINQSTRGDKGGYTQGREDVGTIIKQHQNVTVAANNSQGAETMSLVQPPPEDKHSVFLDERTSSGKVTMDTSALCVLMAANDSKGGRVQPQYKQWRRTCKPLLKT